MSLERQIHSAVIGLVAPGARIEQVVRYRSSPLPFPAKLVLTTDDGPVACVVKVSTRFGVLRHEARVLCALEDLGFPAPRVMAGPHVIGTSTGSVEVLALTHMTGEPLPWIGVTDVATADRTCHLLFGAIDRLHALTPQVAAHDVAAHVPTRTLDQELAAVAQRESPWSGTRIVEDGVAALRKSVPHHRVPLVFSNGDYNPLNVLADDRGVTGWVDFEHACFEDPYIGLPKFQFWSEDSGWSLAAQMGLVERFLHRHDVPPRTFMIRVALRGLTHLHDTTPDEPPVVMLQLIEMAIEGLRHAD